MTVAQGAASPHQSTGSAPSEAWEEVALPVAPAGSENFTDEDDEVEPVDMEQDLGAELRRRKVAQQGRKPEVVNLPEQPPTQAKARAQAANKSLARPSTPTPPRDFTGMSLTTEELMIIGKRREKQEAAGTKKAASAALTGDLAPFPRLGTLWSQDVVNNIACSVKHRMMVHKWKESFWMMRIKQAVMLELPKARWKRNPW